MSDPHASDKPTSDKPTSDKPTSDTLPGDEEIKAAGPEASKQASSPLYAAATPTLHPDDDPSRTESEHDASDTRSRDT